MSSPSRQCNQKRYVDYFRLPYAEVNAKLQIQAAALGSVKSFMNKKRHWRRPPLKGKSRALGTCGAGGLGRWGSRVPRKPETWKK